MAKKSSTTPNISSPASTGGAGTFFEQHVNAYWLTQLLVRGIPPILHDCVVVEVHLQTERLGWHTDDFLIVGERGSGHRRKLVGQVKRAFTVSATDDECKKAVQDFWKDFNSPERFAPDADRFALITFRGTNTLLEHFSGLLDCARAARDRDEFESRLGTSGFLSAKAVEYCNEIRTVVGEIEGKNVTPADVWPFLRVLHVLSLDLNSATGQTEVAMKTLLAHTAGEQDALGTADATWNALLREIGEGMPTARTFQREDLPEAVRRRHSPVSGPDQRALRALSDHSAIILAGVRSTLGGSLHLARGRLVQLVIAQLESTQVVLVSGSAGSGKSGISKDAVDILALDHFAFSFRAEEFASPHFDETLQRSQIPANAALVGAMLAAQGRKVLLIESVERLLEASTRDAFTDLLTLVARDRSWRLILTCRDYSADLVRTCFLAAVGLGHSVVTVPPLDDAELEEIELANPTLARPLANASLRRLLRNPYIIDKALQIAWPEERPLPESEREFRARCWQDIVRAEHRAAGGMPSRREETFVQVALRRARELALYAKCGDLDAEVVAALRGDSLIVSSPQSAVLVAPAHDVLEDWAILQWIEEQYATNDGSIRAVSATLGTYPAVRRTYRKWVGELVDRDAAATDGLFLAVVHDAEMSAQFRDDTLVSLLRSPALTAFLGRHSTELFANDKRLLRRVIHLLRVACVTTPSWLETTAARASLLHVPDGTAWACVLGLVQRNLGSFTEDDRALLLGFIEDWARGVSWQSPYPEGARAVAAIAHWLLPAFEDYRGDNQRKRVLRVIAKIPNADHARFAALLRGDPDCKKRDRAADDLRDIVFRGIEGMPAARDLPDVVVQAAINYLLCSEDEIQDGWGWGSDLELEVRFGIKKGRSQEFYPASAYRGPLRPLLHHHRQLGLALVLTVFNHSAEWYAHPRNGAASIEPPSKMMLTFADGSSKEQWCNGRLWGLYRGMSGRPGVLLCLLMALERWLLEIGEAQPKALDAILLQILKQSDSVALTAVVASAATAFPHASGETLLALLQSPLCIMLDRSRLAQESQAPSKIFAMMPRLNASHEVYEEERKEADARPHRRHDLEIAIADLQLGPLRDRVHEILDRHRAEMPPTENQGEADRLWRLAMHRMDLRQYTVAEDHREASVRAEGNPSEDGGRQSIRLNLKMPEPDVQEMVAESAAQSQATNTRLALLMWGRTVYTCENDKTYEPGQWWQRLQEARTAGAWCPDGDEYWQGQGGPGYVAAVCVRDHWEEMTDDERDWCVDRVCAEVERQADLWNEYARMQRFPQSADRPCAWVLPLLLGKQLSAEQGSRVRQDLVVSLTHAIDEVRWYAAWGIGMNLWGTDGKLTLRCVNALATEARSVQRAAEVELKRPDEQRRPIDLIYAETATLVRQRFYQTDGIADDAHQALDPSRSFEAKANVPILTILGQAPTEPAAVAAFQRLTQTLVAWWDADNDHRGDQHKRRQRNHEMEATVRGLLESFLLRTSADAAAALLQPILDAVDRHPREVQWLLLGLISAEDRQPNTAQFWSLWRLFAERVRRAIWLSDIDREHWYGSEMISAIFLGTGWKEEVSHWRSLVGYAGNIDALFEDLPASSTVLHDYVRFLYHVGEQSLPGAFIRVTKRLQRGNARQMLKEGNTVFLLEVLLQRYVYGRPLELKRRSDLRNAVLAVLDILVEHGSSAAFRMRDDFVTPVPTA